MVAQLLQHILGLIPPCMNCIPSLKFDHMVCLLADLVVYL